MQRLTIWLNIFILAFIPFSVEAQTLSLEEAVDAAQKFYPVIRQKALVQQTASLSIENISKGKLPQMNINGQASYQSDVTSVDIPVPGIKIDKPSKDQYKIYADVSQLLYDGGALKQQQNMQILNAAVEDQKVEVEMYKLKERINQIYLSILFLDEQLKQVELVKSDINTGIKKVQAQVDNGVSLRSNLNTLKAEFLKSNQRAIELLASRKSMIDVLSLFINKQLPENILLTKPASATSTTIDISRPELTLYSKQNRLLDIQHAVIRSKNLPKASAFLQGGYGRPALNLLSNSFEPYAIGGIRFNWSLGGLYTAKREKQIVGINQKSIEIQKETFLLNTESQIKQQQGEISKLQQLIESDREIIDLRNSVKQSANAQLENGVITANDYLREVNAEDQARQLLITHELQLLQAQINLQLTIGK